MKTARKSPKIAASLFTFGATLACRYEINRLKRLLVLQQLVLPSS